MALHHNNKVKWTFATLTLKRYHLLWAELQFALFQHRLQHFVPASLETRCWQVHWKHEQSQLTTWNNLRFHERSVPRIGHRDARLIWVESKSIIFWQLWYGTIIIYDSTTMNGYSKNIESSGVSYYTKLLIDVVWIVLFRIRVICCCLPNLLLTHWS